MLNRMLSRFQTYPVTQGLIFLAAALFAADVTLSTLYHVRFAEAQSLLGAVNMTWLWDGAWWSVATTALHHGDVFHLIFNCVGLWRLGTILERRCGSYKFAVFCVTSVFVSGATQTLFSPYVGLSGLIFGLFGLAWAWRRTDEWLRIHFTEQEVRFGLIWLVGGIFLSALKIMPIGNACHFSGVIYGWLIGSVLFGTERLRQWRSVVFAGHILLIPLLFFTMHPFWNGGYHWHRGDTAEHPAEKVWHYEEATRCDPELIGPWLKLVLIYDENEEVLSAWEWALRGLRQHPSSQPLIDVAQMVWEEFPAGIAQQRARQLIQQILGEQSAAWEKVLIQNNELAEIPAAVSNSRMPARNGRNQAEDHTEDPVEPPIELPQRALDEIWIPNRKLPAPPADNPGSAEEGRAV